jgi:hypothetical protein
MSFRLLPQLAELLSSTTSELPTSRLLVLFTTPGPLLLYTNGSLNTVSPTPSPLPETSSSTP